MRKSCLVVLFFTLYTFVSSVFATNFITPPYAVPYQYGGATYTWVTQTQYDASHSYVFYCKETAGEPTIDFNYATQFYLRFGGGYGWYQSGYCRLLYTSDGGSSWGNININGYYIMSYPSYNSFSQFRSNRDFKYNGFPSASNYTNANFGVSGINQNDILIPQSSFAGGGLAASYLSFPLAGYTAYNAPVSSVMDHSMSSPYAEDDVVLAFNGERGDKGYGFSQGCYKKSGGGDFGSGFNYVGTTGTGGKPYFCYDGHPGYDYPQASGVDILAPAAGKLCVATTYVTQQSPANVWRSPTECGDIPSVVTERWLDTGGFNAFYIFHTEYINGTTDDYMTVFLHSNNLENTVVWSTVASQGYVNVTRGQHIADVGSVGAGSANHLHLEVYKKVSGNWSRVDPYGDGTNNILWQH